MCVCVLLGIVGSRHIVCLNMMHNNTETYDSLSNLKYQNDEAYQSWKSSYRHRIAIIIGILMAYVCVCVCLSAFCGAPH